MAPKDTFALGRQGGHTEVGQAPDVVHPAMSLLVGSQNRSIPLGRFLLSSTGFHLIFAWVIISFGLPKAPSAPQPLVVTIIERASSESSAGSGRLVRTPAGQPPAPGYVAPPANVKAQAQPRVSPPAPPVPMSSPARTAETLEPATLDQRIDAPKTVGMSANGSYAVGAGTPGVFAAGSPSPRPVLLGAGEDGEVGSGSASRGGAGRLDAALAPPTPSVTIGSSQGGAGRGPAPTAGAGGWSGNGGLGGKSSAPNYGINPLPKYPLLAREKGYEGTVYLRVLVRADGRVERLAVDRSSGYEILDRAAIDSVKEWAFFPAKKGGKSVESWVLLPVKFALN